MSVAYSEMSIYIFDGHRVSACFGYYSATVPLNTECSILYYQVVVHVACVQEGHTNATNDTVLVCQYDSPLGFMVVDG
jgi:hypothetical protein